MPRRPDRECFDERLEELSDSDRMQNRRLEMCVDLTGLFQSVFGDCRRNEEPRLVDPSDEESDLVVDMDFGEGLAAQLKVTYDGDMEIDNERMFLELADRRIHLNEVIMFSSDGNGALNLRS